MAIKKLKPKWACSNCKTTDTALQYRSGKMKKCRDCQRFYNMGVNAKRNRKIKYTPKMKISEPDFLKWSRGRRRKCRYCAVRDEHVGDLKMKTQIGLNLDALGIDRLDPDKDYEINNIDFCCFGCNKAKGDVFSDREMKLIGKAIKKVWQQRQEPFVCTPARGGPP